MAVGDNFQGTNRTKITSAVTGGTLNAPKQAPNKHQGSSQNQAGPGWKVAGPKGKGGVGEINRSN